MNRNKLMLIVGLAFSTVASAQVDLTNTGVLKISSGSDILYINGNFSNTSAASLTNNGQLHVKQNLTNNQAAMTAGTGTLYLNGSSVQTVSGAQIFKTWNLVTNNGSGITLNNDLSIGGAHTFTAGLITTSATPNYLVYEAGSSYSGSGDTKHVNGWVKKYGNTNFSFPVGNATYERTVAIENLSASSEFNAKYFQPTSNPTQVQFPIYSMDPYEYWQVNKVTGGSANVHLNWDNSKVLFSNYAVADIVVAYYNGTAWTDVGGTASGNANTTGDVTSNLVSAFGNFGFGSKSFPLAVNFISFTAQRRNYNTELKWITSQETNTDHYEIQRSETGNNFVTINSTVALNNLATTNYSYNDNSVLNRIAYYRVAAVNRDGKIKYSNTIAVYDQSYLINNVQILNPASHYITIRSKVNDPAANVVITNSAGQELVKKTISIIAGSDNQISLPTLAGKGIYFIKIAGSNVSYSGKFLLY